jgi:hypothetical protein
VPLTGGTSVNVYGEASRWTRTEVLVRWKDDDGQLHSAWIPTSSVRHLTASEWDIIEYNQSPEQLRPIRWTKRIPGFLPE